MWYNVFGDFMRLDKFLGNLGYGSRTTLKKDIKNGNVLVNNQIVFDCGMEIIPEKDIVTFYEEEVFYKEKIYLMMNKPKGYICANKDGLHKTVVDLVKKPYDRFTFIIVGRLDLDTEGLLFLTTDGLWAHKMISPNHNIFKRYYVTLRKKLENYKCLEDGITILDGKNNPYKTKKAKISVVDDNHCYIDIQEGKFHQVKRMFEYIGNEVIELKRTMVGNYSLDEDLKPSEYKEISVLDD